MGRDRFTGSNGRGHGRFIRLRASDGHWRLRMSYPDDINWKLIVGNLRRKGLTYAQVAMETGFSVGELRQMESEIYYPPYLNIMKLLDMHHSFCPGKHQEVGNVSYEEES